MKNYCKNLLSMGICSALLISVLPLSGCGTRPQGTNASDSFSEDNVNDPSGTENSSSAENASQASEVPVSADSNALPAEIVLPPADSSVYTDFAVRLFRESLEPEKNTLISPLSVINALTMTANGAKGETLAQMESLLGTDISSLSEYLCNYNSLLPSGENYKLHTANSIWLKDEKDFIVEESFLQTNSRLLNAEIYQAAFDDSTPKSINQWVAKNTDDMIPEIVDEVPADALMYLINALAFDADWQSPYNSYQIKDGTFTMEDGTEQNVQFMHSGEHTFIQDVSAQNEVTALGFLKYYADGKYAFAALLPDESISIEDYVDTLSGEKLCQMLANTSDANIQAALPKFESEYSVEMRDMLANMGMTAAFDPQAADFSGIGSMSGGNLYISRVIHKTYIAVDERGTKAGAATAVEMRCTSAAPVQEVINITLNRPFVYMILDCEENLPIFIGTVMKP